MGRKLLLQSRDEANYLTKAICEVNGSWDDLYIEIFIYHWDGKKWYGGDVAYTEMPLSEIEIVELPDGFCIQLFPSHNRQINLFVGEIEIELPYGKSVIDQIKIRQDTY